MSSNMTSPFADRLSRRSKYEALVSKYEAAAEVVRTHADTDVQLQPQDQPIAEEEPHQLARQSPGESPRLQPVSEVHLEILPAPSRGARNSIGGTPAQPPMSPGTTLLMRRGSQAASGVLANTGSGVLTATGYGGGGSVAGGGGLVSADFPGPGERREEAEGRWEEAEDEGRGGQRGALALEHSLGGGGGGGAGGVLSGAISGALGGLATLAGLARGAAVGGGGAAEAGADEPGQSEIHGAPGPSELGMGMGLDMGLTTRSHRKHRSDHRVKKAVLAGTNWLKVDYRGIDTIIRVDKHKLMHKLGVQARDLRLLDITSATPPAILGRDKAIIVNLWYIKAIITLDYCLVVSPDSIADALGRKAIEAFVGELKAKLSTDRKARSYVGLATSSQVTVNAGYGSLQLPFELKVLEVCLDRTAAHLEESTKMVEGDAYPTLDALTHKVTANNLERARRIKNRLVRLTKNVESAREVIERFLNDDGDMHRLHLTGAELSRQVSMRPADLGRLSAGLLPAPSGSVVDSDSSSDSSIDEAETAAVEMLLEAYFMQFDHTFNRLQTVDEYIKDTEDLVTIQLDQHRNQLITIDLILTSFTTSLGLMTVVGGYFGQNLDSGLQEAPNVFNAVVLTTTLTSLALFVGFVFFLYTQKLLYF